MGRPKEGSRGWEAWWAQPHTGALQPGEEALRRRLEGMWHGGFLENSHRYGHSSIWFTTEKEREKKAGRQEIKGWRCAIRQVQMKIKTD